MSWNLLRTYERYKDKASKGKIPLSLRKKFRGVFFMFSGRLDHPAYHERSSDLYGNNSPLHPSKNHKGVYDLITFSIPRMLEYLARGNWLPTKKSQTVCKIIFGVIPIWPALALVRYIFGAILTGIVAIPLCIVHGCTTDKSKQQEPVVTENKPSSTKLIDDVIDAANLNTNILSFNKNYNKVTNEIKSLEDNVDVDAPEINVTNLNKWKNKAIKAARSIKFTHKQQLVGFFKKETFLSTLNVDVIRVNIQNKRNA